MAKSRLQKEDMVKTYRERITNSKALYFVDAKGISAVESTQIKKDLYDLESDFSIVKNRLFKIALEESGLQKPEGFEKGQHGVIFAGEDKITDAAKVIYEFIKTKEKDTKVVHEIVGGIFEGNAISKNEVIELASLPSRDELIAKVVGTMNAPIAGFATVLAANIRGLVNVVNAYKEKLETN